MYALGGEHHPGHIPMKIQQWIARLEANGWYQVRQNSSHCRFHHAAKTGTVTVAGKPLVALSSGTLNSILKQTLRSSGVPCCCRLLSQTSGIKTAMRVALLPFFFFSQTCVAASPHEVAVGAQSEQICAATTLSILGKFLGVDGFDVRQAGDGPSIVTAAACKKNPAKPQITIAAVAYDAGKDDAKMLIVALINESERKVVASHRWEVGEDAGMRVESGSLWIDTAPYLLASGVRAFSVDLTSGYIPHCGDGGSGAERTLYVQQGEKLRPIFGLTMSSWHFLQGGNPRCVGSGQASDITTIESTDLSIGVANTSTNGYRDLVIKAVSSEDSGQAVGKQPFLYKARYDGQQYRSQGPTEGLDQWKR